MEMMLAGRTRTKLEMFDGTKPVQCRRHLTKLHSYVHLKHTLLPSDLAQVAPCAVFHCPAGHLKAAAFPFVATNQHKSIWCKDRKAPIRSKLWQCSCRRPWHECAIHSPISRLHDVLTNQPLRRNRNASLQTRRSSTLEQLDILEPNALATRAIMGPILQARFPHLASSSSREAAQAVPQAGRKQNQM